MVGKSPCNRINFVENGFREWGKKGYCSHLFVFLNLESRWQRLFELVGLLPSVSWNGLEFRIVLTFSESDTTSVYRYFEHLTLNFTIFPFLDFLIRADLASFLRAISRKSLMSWTCFGIYITSQNRVARYNYPPTREYGGFLWLTLKR